MVGGAPTLFDDDACLAIHYFSGGVPRLTNLLCDLALTYGFADGANPVSIDTVIDVVMDRNQSGLSAFRAIPDALDRDGVKALIASGQADPNRICIFGASFGGYAALYAGATHPELYECVVSMAGDADLIASMRFERETYGKDSSTYEYWLKSMGDPDKDAAMMRAASPTTYAATYKPPVLLIHGEDDDIVDPKQSTLMNRALKNAGRDVRLITYKNEGHRDWEPEDEKAALTEIAKFIEAHIAPAVLAPRVATAAPAVKP